MATRYLEGEKKLYFCNGCDTITGCENVFIKSIMLCSDCPTGGRCQVKNNPHNYNHYTFIPDGVCEKCKPKIKQLFRDTR